MKLFWILFAAVVILLILLVWKCDRLMNLAYLKRTEWVRVVDRRSYISATRDYGKYTSNRRETFGVTFRLTDGTNRWLLMPQREFARCSPHMTGRLTFRGDSYIAFEPETPPADVERLLSRYT
ncbi:MAG: DUF2500 family protein [Candidatus Howiella sp.]|jgi:hypothetical protein